MNEKKTEKLRTIPEETVHSKDGRQSLHFTQIVSMGISYQEIYYTALTSVLYFFLLLIFWLLKNFEITNKRKQFSCNLQSFQISFIVLLYYNSFLKIIIKHFMKERLYATQIRQDFH